MRAALAVVAMLCAGCSRPEDEAAKRASWEASVRMTLAAWSDGSVSTSFTADTLRTAAKRTKNGWYGALADAVEKNDSARVRELLGHE